MGEWKLSSISAASAAQDSLGQFLGKSLERGHTMSIKHMQCNRRYTYTIYHHHLSHLHK